MPQDKPKLSSLQRTLLYALMAEARVISNPELDECCGLRIVGEDRRVLKAEKLVTSEKSGRTYEHALTERGWTWCRAEFTATPGGRPAPLDRVVHRMTAALDRYLSANRLTIDQLFTAEVPELAEEDAEASIVDRVRRAYADLAAEPEDWVSLTDLRRQLDGLPRHEVDQVLKDLDGKGGTLIPEANQKTLTAEDRAAAVRIGGEDNHLLSMAE
ncbi:hypothetical protein [Amycolatopsis sp. NBC_01480]|jgi:hypothetical protein|uniref:hypothetical protein n=1 Tax=Amycolatopsis sp. NBC_01480 TaxID=2903562 RepID=UPI002E2BCE8D|nr:hypothetical protein [Amycolatopsis sp. NBC_01480]